MDAGFFSVTVEVDRPRELRIDFNVICEVEKLTGMNFLVDPSTVLSAQAIRALCWCSWKQEDPTLTLEQTGLIIGAHLADVIDAVMQSTVMAFPNKEELDSELDPPVMAPTPS